MSSLARDTLSMFVNPWFTLHKYLLRGYSCFPVFSSLSMDDSLHLCIVSSSSFKYLSMESLSLFVSCDLHLSVDMQILLLLVCMHRFTIESEFLYGALSFNSSHVFLYSLHSPLILFLITSLSWCSVQHTRKYVVFVLCHLFKHSIQFEIILVDKVCLGCP